MTLRLPAAAGSCGSRKGAACPRRRAATATATAGGPGTTAPARADGISAYLCAGRYVCAGRRLPGDSDCRPAAASFQPNLNFRPGRLLGRADSDIDHPITVTGEVFQPNLSWAAGDSDIMIDHDPRGPGPARAAQAAAPACQCQ